ncbi:hypothetical protein [Halopiger xanaduensis]|uniref:PH domain-containing protein n=1 Tax=Halopiger xanaduensis (strain DSM 18323 / JCM 14033 / SH-6) TaxID=797210 RepID=F8D6J9_HALXS|nr:hypothetical protein [Halopiger xanaduensis]AEH36595.1 hypothetical protein Halxa_1970 [Halopiger xanaduensis SH-6]
MSSSTAVDPGVEYQAAVGAYIGALLTGVVALALVVGDASSGALLSLLPSVFTAGLLIGAIVAWSHPETAVRLGSLRWPIAVCCLPAVALGAAVWLLARADIVGTDWRLLPAALAAVGATLAGWLLGAIARDSDVDSVVGDPVASWTWELSGPDYTLLGWGLACFVVGAGCYLAFGDLHPFVILFVVGVTFVLQGLPTELWDDDTVRVPISIIPLAYEADAPDFSRGEFRVADAGLVVVPSMQPAYKSLVPWDRIGDVRLTDDELVLERRRRWKPAIRCDRSVIDDPDALEATLRRYVRGGGDGVDSTDSSTGSERGSEPGAKRERNRTDP